MGEENDPFTIAVQAAMRDLRRDGAADYVRKDYQESEKVTRDQIKRDLKLDAPKGPKEWSPKRGGSESKREEQLELAVERHRNNHPNDLTLYVMFDDLGALRGWVVDYPDFWQGHSGPVAAILAHENLSYKDIQKEVEEALGDLDWEEIEKDLEEDDGA